MKKYALISGASGGIGQAIAKELAAEGWNLYLHYNQGRESIENLIEELSQFPVDLLPIQADLSSAEGAKLLLTNIFSVHAAVFAGGVASYGLFQDTTAEEMDRLWNIHVKTPMLVIQGLLPKLQQQKQSSIVLVSSIWGQMGAACEVAYSTVKGAQLSLVKALSRETARSGLRVNAVAPGAVNTRMISQFNEQELEALEEEIPMGRLAEPREIADTVKFLLSPSSSYITGQVIGVNGGWHT
ncbi:MAG TPA: SDR family oxidoreductase [Chondromyces sp.]|nr:SDR family oxidoreductase [Chondromyces sp.]